MAEATIKVEGMSCGGCVRSVTEALKAQPGVGDAEVTLETGQARIDYDPALVSVAQLRQAVEDAGFDSPA
ncbi:heavy-metal-associated domain-containing protein [Aromatoleum sp.]|uniref:heavy-metal-associated domain-containing protein n=1 Tax=Aromatoleum sp. TaxID=2307007 RepID=UPI002FC97F0E